MPTISPLDNTGNGIVQLTVSINGKAISNEYAIKSVQVVHAVNTISCAELVVQGSMNSNGGALPVSDNDDFNPGNAISISAGYGNGKEQSIFLGVIVSHALQIDTAAGFTVNIVCRHAAAAMMYNAHSAVFTNQTDSEMMAGIAAGYGLKTTIASTPQQQETVVQNRTTDWQFILATCSNYGFIICMDQDLIQIGKPLLDSRAVLRVAAGESLMSFTASISAEYQPGALKAAAWDFNAQAMLGVTAQEPAVKEQGSIAPRALAGQLGQTVSATGTATPFNKDELQAWADAALLRQRLSAINGKVSFIGNAAVKTGNCIELQGVGKKFEGNAFVTGVSHSCNEGSWITTVTFGLPPLLVDDKNNRLTSSALTAQLPPVHGLQLALVQQTNADPQLGYRVLVNMVAGGGKSSEVWARMASFYASASAGAVFWPEAGDEVIVGFLEGDARYPVILGSLYSQKNKPPEALSDDDNHIKSITTRSNMRLLFNERSKSIAITTPAGNSFTVSDEDKAILIADENGNTIKLSTGGITVESTKDILLKAAGNIRLEAGGAIALRAAQDVLVAGLNISNEAAIGFTGKGAATAELSASGQTTVKGGMVMIN